LDKGECEGVLFLDGEATGGGKGLLLELVQLLAFVHLLVELDAHLAILLLPGAVGRLVVGHSGVAGLVLGLEIAFGAGARIKVHGDGDDCGDGAMVFGGSMAVH